ncbi:MAG TPA: cell wall hydrolase, partial [Phenylobacterium sp.]
PQPASPPAGPPELINLPLSGEAARLWNASVGPETRARPARPFVIEGPDIEDRGRAISCLTAAIYYEAGAESAAGQQAVAQVVLNRLRHPDFPKTVCGVVFEGAERQTGCQFTFTCDGSLARAPSVRGWKRAEEVAEAALDGFVDRAVGYATHYHAVYVVPYWSPGLLKVATIGAHIFYQRPGRDGEPSAFVGRYAGGEELVSLSVGEDAPAPVLDVQGAQAPAPVVAEAETASALAASDFATPAADTAPVQVELAAKPKLEIFRSLVAPEGPRPRLAMSPDGA